MNRTVIDAGNATEYQRSSVKAHYISTAFTGLTPQEQICFSRIPPDSYETILDIGIGAGRTTGPLAKVFRTYIGVDYSAPLVEAAKDNFPERDLRVMDARALDAVEVYDCILFSFNGIDYIDYEDRLKFFGAAYRALKPGGHFIYSTHNAGYFRRQVYMNHLWVEEIFRSFHSLRGMFRRISNYYRQRVGDQGSYFIVNDPGLQFGLMTVYVDIATELKNLRSTGFEIILTIGSAKEGENFDTNDAWVYVLAHKPLRAASL